MGWIWKKELFGLGVVSAGVRFDGGWFLLGTLTFSMETGFVYSLARMPPSIGWGVVVVVLVLYFAS